MPILWFGAGAAVVGGVFLAIGIANGTLFVGMGIEQEPNSQRDFASMHVGSSENIVRTLPNEIERSNTVMELGRIGNDFSSLAAFYSDLAQADEAELLRLLNQTKDLRAGHQREFVRTELLRRFAQTNPEQSLRRARQFPRMEQEPFVEGIFHEWSRKNLQKSVESASQLPGSLRKIALQAILESRDDLNMSERREISGGNSRTVPSDQCDYKARNSKDHRRSTTGLEHDPERRTVRHTTARTVDLGCRIVGRERWH